MTLSAIDYVLLGLLVVTLFGALIARARSLR